MLVKMDVSEEIPEVIEQAVCRAVWHAAQTLHYVRPNAGMGFQIVVEKPLGAAGLVDEQAIHIFFDGML